MKIIYLSLCVGILFAGVAKANPPNPAKPIRMAYLKGTISKSILDESNWTGKEEKVCDFSVEVPLYGFTSKDESLGLVNSPDCLATVNGQEVKVYVSALMQLQKEKDEVNPWKEGALLLNVGDPGSEFYTFQIARTGSEDLGVKSLRLEFNSREYRGGEKNHINESFYVSASFQDEQAGTAK